MKTSYSPILALVLIAITTFSANAEVIQFSGQLSDNDQPNAGAFDAEVIWGFDGGTNVLTMQIFNQTSWPNDYTLSELYLFQCFERRDINVHPERWATVEYITQCQFHGRPFWDI